MHRPFEKTRREQENMTVKQKQLGKPSVHQRAAFFCAGTGTCAAESAGADKGGFRYGVCIFYR